MQRLPNGNTLICEGAWGRIFKVTPEKAVVWEYINPVYFKVRAATDLGWNNQVFRAYRYGFDFEGIQGKQLDPDRYELTVRESPRGKKK